MNNASEWYSITNVDELETPGLVLHPDRIRSNIIAAIGMVPDIAQLRPHVKTHKLREVTTMMLEEGITKFKCATIAEAEMLAMQKAPDVLIAYQPVGPNVYRFRQLASRYPETNFSCIVDSINCAEQINDVFADEHLRPQVYMDINVGMNRTGVLPEHAIELYKQLKNLSHCEIAGIHAYDGHIVDSPLFVRKQKADEVFAYIEDLCKAIQALDRSTVSVVIGGTPTFPVHLHRKNVELSPGTFVFWDHGYSDLYPEMPFQYAALLVGRVISIVNEKTLCLDIGYKSVASEKPLPRMRFLNATSALPIAHSEEHLVVQVADTTNAREGEVWFAVPTHICPTVALFEKVAIIRNNEVSGYWNVIARKRKINI